MVKLGLDFVVLALQLRDLIQVPQCLLVLVQGQGGITGLECFVAKLFAVGGDLEDLLSIKLLIRVFGEVLVCIAESIGGLGVAGKCLGCGACELTTIDNDAIACGLVTTRGRKVLDLADDGLSTANMAKDDVLVVKVGSWDGRNKELGAIGAY